MSKGIHSPNWSWTCVFFGGMVFIFFSSQRVWARKSGLQQSVPYASMDGPLICATVPLFMYRSDLFIFLYIHICVCIFMYAYNIYIIYSFFCLYIFTFRFTYMLIYNVYVYVYFLNIYVYLFTRIYKYIYIHICCFICCVFPLLFWKWYIASSRFVWYSGIIKYCLIISLRIWSR